MPRPWEYAFSAPDRTGERIRAAAAREDEADGNRDRPCGRGQWCSQAVREKQDDGSTLRIPAKGTRAFCFEDEILIGSCLRTFPDGYALLSAMLGYRETAEVIVRVPFGPNVAIRTDLDELARLLIDSAMAWLERVAEVDTALTAPDTSAWRGRSLGSRAGLLLAYAVPRLASRVSALTALGPEPMLRPGLIAAMRCGSPLGPAGDTVLVEASGADGGNEIMRLAYLWRGALGLTPPAREELLGVVCPECGMRALRRADPPQHDTDPVWFACCSHCRHLIGDGEYRLWTERLVRFHRSLVTPAVLAAAGLKGDESRTIADVSAMAVAG